MDPAASAKPMRPGSERTELLQMSSALVRVRTQVSIRGGRRQYYYLNMLRYVYTAGNVLIGKKCSSFRTTLIFTVHNGGTET